ncbi:MAG: VWA domain-containing protein [Alphaproteobacteria bacterium]|nr:VWA domain-containing protein [Alphaproteobacteria bacterium]
MPSPGPTILTPETTYSGFHFSEPQWLWALAVVPVLWILYRIFYSSGPTKNDRLRAFADPHLLPHLISGTEGGLKGNGLWRALLLWSAIWICSVLAMAGPRWDYTEIEAFRPANSLVIVLDLSRSMDVADVKPSRLARARQEIEDISRSSRGLNIGLVAFANIAHMITPLTDDKATLERLLPSIKTDLVYTQGSRLSPALHMARRMLESQKGEEKHILLLSDGGYEEPYGPIYRALREITDKGMKVHVLGLGTSQGGPVPDGIGGYVRSSTGTVISKMDTGLLKQIASDGNGIYREASYLDDDTNDILRQITIKADQSEDTRKILRFWEERFYVFLFPCILLVLPWFRRGAAFPVVLLLLLSLSTPAQAFSLRDLFLTKEQQGRQALEQKNYEEAEKMFSDDPYRRGVVEYKSGKYDEAEKSFSEVQRPEVRENAEYNRGNAQMMSGKLKDAIKTYEKVLKDNPDHKDAQHNLDIAKKMLEEQNKQQQQQENQNQKQKQDQQQKQNQKDQQKQDKNQQQQKQDDQGGDQKDQKQQQNSEQQKEGNQNENKSGEQKSSQEDSNQQSGENRKSQKQEQQNSQDQKDQSARERSDHQQDQKKQQSQSGEENRDQQEKQKEEQQNQQTAGNEQNQKDRKDFPPQPEQADQKQNEKQEKEAQEKQQERQQQQQQQKQDQENQKQAEQKQDNLPPPEQPGQPLPTQKDDNSQQEQQSGQVDRTKRPSLRDEANLQRDPDQKPRTQQDVDADQWLSHIDSDTETFLKNKFYIESRRSGATQGRQTW